MGIKRKKNYLYLQLWLSVSNFTTSYNIFKRTGGREKKATKPSSMVFYCTRTQTTDNVSGQIPADRRTDSLHSH